MHTTTRNPYNAHWSASCLVRSGNGPMQKERLQWHHKTKAASSKQAVVALQLLDCLSCCMTSHVVVALQHPDQQGKRVAAAEPRGARAVLRERRVQGEDEHPGGGHHHLHLLRVRRTLQLVPPHPQVRCLSRVFSFLRHLQSCAAVSRSVPGSLLLLLGSSIRVAWMSHVAVIVKLKLSLDSTPWQAGNLTYKCQVQVHRLDADNRPC